MNTKAENAKAILVLAHRTLEEMFAEKTKLLESCTALAADSRWGDYFRTFEAAMHKEDACRVQVNIIADAGNAMRVADPDGFNEEMINSGGNTYKDEQHQGIRDDLKSTMMALGLPEEKIDNAFAYADKKLAKRSAKGKVVRAS